MTRRAQNVALGLVTVLWATLLLGWVQLTPLYRAADETLHVDLVLHLLEGGSYAAPGTLELDPEVRASYPLAGLSSEERPELASLYPLPLSSTDVPPRDASFDELEPRPGLPAITNQMTQHPPLYYRLVAGGARLLPGFSDWSFTVQVGALRLLSAALLLPLPALAFAGARRLRATGGVATAAALLPLAVPQLAHVGASVNNDALLTVLGAAVTAPLLAVSRGDASRRTAAVVGVLLGLALLTKALAFGLLVWAALAYAAALLGAARAQRSKALTSGLLAAGLALAVGGWWWVRNLLRYGTVQPSGTAKLPALEHDADLLEFTWSFLTRVTASTWGNFGWLEVELPEAVQLVALAVVVLGLVLALSRPCTPGARRAGALALTAFCLQVAIVYQQSLTNYLRGGYLAGLQGRYLFAFVAVLAALVAVGLSGLLPQRARERAPLLALGAVAAMQAAGALTALQGFWWPDGEGLRRALALSSAWAPFPRPVTLVAVLVGTVATVLLVRQSTTAPGAVGDEHAQGSPDAPAAAVRA